MVQCDRDPCTMDAVFGFLEWKGDEPSDDEEQVTLCQEHLEARAGGDIVILQSHVDKIKRAAFNRAARFVEENAYWNAARLSEGIQDLAKEAKRDG